MKIISNKMPLLTLLEPNTEYVAVFDGLEKSAAAKCYALFKTKDVYEDMKSFKVRIKYCNVRRIKITSIGGASILRKGDLFWISNELIFIALN